MKLSLFLSTLLLTWLMAAPTLAAQPKTAIYLSVFKAHENPFWARKACKNIADAFQENDYVGTEVHCDWNQDEKFLSEKNVLARRSNEFQYMLELRETEGDYHLRWINWSKTDDLDFTQVGFTLKKDQHFKLSLKKLLNNLLDSQNHQLELRRHWITEAIQTTQKISVDHPLTEGEMTVWLNAKPENKSYLKNIIAAHYALGLGVGDEIKNMEAAKVLWDRDSLGLMLGETSKLKKPIFWKALNKNQELTLLCRSNSLGDLDTLLCSKIASSTWEMILEYQNSLSLKKELLEDDVLVFLSGTFAELKTIFQGSENSLIQKNLKEIFKSIPEIQELMPIQRVRPGPNFHLEPQDLQGKQTSETIYLDLPQGPKKLITTLDFKRRFNNQMLMAPYRDFNLTTQIALAAYYEKNKSYEFETPIRGYSLFIGGRKAVDNRTSFSTPSDPRYSDFIGSVHVFGSTLQITTYSHGWRIQAVIDIYADFASVRSYAADPYVFDSETLRLAGGKNKDQYYAVGSTNLAQIIFEHGRWSYDFSVQHQRLSNLNGVAPNIFVMDNLASQGRADQFTGLEAGAQYRMTQKLSLRWAINETQRSGTIQDTATKSSLVQTVGVQLIYKF